MTAYADSGVIAKLYVPEPNSAEAVALVSAYRPPLPFTQLQSLELRNALRLKVFRREITRPQHALTDVYRKAEELSGRFTPRTGCRSLDILHVAAAVVLGARDFLTFDTRQGKVARAARLRVRPSVV